jgi:GNAT superfamily N-acetyltransferase
MRGRSRRKEGRRKKIPYPEGGNEEVWSELLSAIAEYEKRTMGDRKHWCTSPLSSRRPVPPCLFTSLALLVLAVDPAYHRRGIGKAIVSDGIKRARAQGLPLFVSASQTGKLLYKGLGFEVKFDPIITSANIRATMMTKESDRAE